MANADSGCAVFGRRFSASFLNFIFWGKLTRGVSGFDAGVKDADKLNGDDDKGHGGEDEDPGEVPLLDELIEDAVGDGQAEGDIGPSLEGFPALRAEVAEREVVGDDEEHYEEERRDEAYGVGRPELVGLKLQGVEALKEVHPHAAAEVDGEADGCVEDGEEARPDADVAPEVEAHGIRLAAKRVPRAQKQGGGEEEKTAVGGRHAEAMAEVGRGGGEVDESGAACGYSGEKEVALDALGPVSADGRHEVVGNHFRGGERGWSRVDDDLWRGVEGLFGE